MANMNNDGAASVAPVFELRDISADAVFMMTALLSKLGVGQLLQLALKIANAFSGKFKTYALNVFRHYSAPPL